MEERLKGLKEIGVFQVAHEIEKTPDHRTWSKYTETTFYMTSQWWKIGDDGDALVGCGPKGDCHAVARIGDVIDEDRGEHACLDSVLEKMGYRGTHPSFTGMGCAECGKPWPDHGVTCSKRFLSREGE